MNRNYSISDETVVKRVQAAVELELAKRKAMDVSIIRYDRGSNSIYKENSDGTMEKVGTRLRKGRYSEQLKKEA
ncbi:hypothetical protein [Dubosiella muris]|uniref:Uncharacterized protein n=1 Tax=Dubosiella muris TaxID=3038133 RepID=A0AC61R7I5_9FIRM|nr:hypothetical protein [Dubosiella muris]TGY66027.1 hypothetical protein E5336_05935 [Dubosiella muris]